MSDASAAFQVDGDQWTPSGPLTMDSVADVLRASVETALPASGIIDLGRIDAVDSAGVALLLAWERRAAAEGKTVTFAHLPPSLASLARLYDVEELLGASPV